MGEIVQGGDVLKAHAEAKLMAGFIILESVAAEERHSQITVQAAKDMLNQRAVMLEKLNSQDSENTSVWSMGPFFWDDIDRWTNQVVALLECIDDEEATKPV